MRLTRVDRTERTRTERARRFAVAFAVTGIVGLLGTALALSLAEPASERHTGDPVAPSGANLSVPMSAPVDESTPAVCATAVAEAVEVPALSGRTLAEAHVLLEAAGLTASVTEDPDRPAEAIGEARQVLEQDPVGGVVVPSGTTVTVLVAGGGVSGGPIRDTTGFVVVVDPGHQRRGDSSMEPIGPGAAETKPRVTGGTTGVYTRVPEYEVALQIAMNLKARLREAGVTVVMTRTTNDVNISNAERAAVANRARADLFIRIHADGSPDPAIAGISTLFPGLNRWTGPIAEPSRRAARSIHQATIAATGASDRGVHARTDLSGFNWATVPSVLVECGFMTNPVEDRLLASPHYQDRLAQGMTQGILAFLGE